MNVAAFSPLCGKALVFDGSGKPVHTVELDRPEPQPAEWIHTGMYLQSIGAIEQAPAGEYPYSEFRALLAKKYREHQALRWTITAIDPRTPLDMRKRAAKQALKLFAKPETAAWVKSIFIQIPVPANGDLAGLPSEELRDLLAGWLREAGHPTGL